VDTVAVETRGEVCTAAGMWVAGMTEVELMGGEATEGVVLLGGHAAGSLVVAWVVVVVAVVSAVVAERERREEVVMVAEQKMWQNQ
jgi:hypothetical protein